MCQQEKVCAGCSTAVSCRNNQVCKRQAAAASPHKHAAIIKAWADGAACEYYRNEIGEWADVGSAPAWLLQSTYRIKPKAKSLGQVAFEGYWTGAAHPMLWNDAASSTIIYWETAASCVVEEWLRRNGE